MTYPGDDADFESVCEYLGLIDDADSHATYATEAHRCYRLERPTKIASTHQDAYCLGPNHETCPVYLGQGVAQTTRTASPPPRQQEGDPEPAGAVQGPGGAAPAPSPQRPQRPPRDPGALGPRPRPGGISMPAATIGLLGLAVVVVGLAFLVQQILGGDSDSMMPGDNLATQEALTSAQTATAEAGGSTFDDGGDEPAPGNGDAAPPDEGDDAAPPEDDGAPADEGPTTHVVEPGDTCFALADRYGSTVEEIIEVNGLNAECSNLGVGEEITIP